ncbi:hypothetical protein Dsin_026689 [Dipteronia sinensis]|uniref:Uncharacterized protein n=1 Tax=Dipteronia sinensis TaxID=43782 RepID=A0AAE0DZH4_9ROSI|nr:hypothetical protein Dsin_026689 [Dipteronia sinensis]
MDSLQHLVFLSLLAFLLLLFLKNLRKKLPYPPGPKGYPIIGNMTMMDQLTHRGLARLATKYGGLLHLQMGSLHIVAVSTPEMAREVLQVQDGIFSNRPANVAITYLTYDRADMAFADYGPFWRQMRKICVIKLFSRRRAQSWASVREEVDSTVQTVMKKTGVPVNIGELVFTLTKNITYRAAFGSFSHDRQDEFVKIMQEFSKLFGAFNIADFIPWLGWIHANEFNRRLARARGSLDGFIDTIIDDHLAKKRGNTEGKLDGVEVESDMVDELMAFYSEEDASATKKYVDDSQSGFKINRDHIKALIMDIMFGGTETVASAIEWTMSELLKSPEDLKKVQQELSDKVGLTRFVHESDLENLTYLKICIKETLRLHPPIPLLLHETAEDSVISGYRIPVKSRVMINAYAIGRDPSAWEDPDAFKPSRFLNDGAPDFKGNDFEYIPFGSGRRSCPGMQLGLYALELSVANLLHCFNWVLPDGMKPSELDMEDMFGLTAPRAIRLISSNSSMDSLQLIVSLSLLALLLLHYLINLRKRLPYPPGPKGYPIIGNMTMMDQLTHHGLTHLAAKYGGLLHLKMGSLHIVAVSTPEMAREVLQVQDIIFSNRPTNIAITYLTYDRADMAFADYGPFWRQMRKIFVMKLFSRRRAESWASVREEVDSAVQSVVKQIGVPVKIGELIFSMTRKITYKAAFGSVSHEGQDEFVKIMQEFSKLFGAFNIADFIPWLGWVHASEFNRRLIRARESLDGFIDTVIDDHLAKKRGNTEGKLDGDEVDSDMVDELMAFYSEEDASTVKKYDIMFGGTETVAAAIEWTMSELMKSSEDLKKVQQELSDKVGLTRFVHESDLENLTYLKCCIKETLRLHPPIPLLLHETSEDSVISGYRIPAKSRVMINVYAIGREPSAWEDPDTFKPSRFLNDDARDFKGSDFEYIPFGSGRRSCPGMQLGLYTFELCMANLLHSFNWVLPDGMKPSELNMEDLFGLTTPRAVQLVAVPSYRLNCPLKV